MRKILEDADNIDSRPRKRPRYEDDIATQSTRSSSVDDETQSNATDTPTDEYLKVQSTAQTTHGQGDPAASSQRQQKDDTCSQLSPPQLGSSLQEQSTLLGQLDTTDQVKAKRDEVRKAHRYLQEHCDLEKLQLGHVPSSWASEEEGIAKIEENAQKSPQPTTPVSSKITPETLKSPSDIAEDGPVSPRPYENHPPPNQDSQHTDSLSISVSESLIAPSATENEDPSAEGPNEAREQRAQLVRDRMKARTRVRVNAFIAAMRDTYESWADIAMVSAGDNHTEEEMEL